MVEKPHPSVVHASPASEAEGLLKDIEMAVSPDDEYSASRSSGFDGSGVVEILLYVSSARVASKVAEVLVAWLKLKSSRKVKIHGREVQGYSAPDVARILMSVREEPKRPE